MKTVYSSGWAATPRRVRPNALYRILSALLMAFILFAVMFSVAASVPAAAEDAPGADFSDCPDDSDNNGLDADARQACGIKNEKGADGKSVGDSNSTYDSILNGSFDDIMYDDTADAGIGDTWRMLMYRIVSPSYYLNSGVSTDGSQLNDANSAVHDWKPDRYCPSLDKASDYTNDNCDVPGIVTQAMQNVLYSVLPSGISGGDRVSAKTPFDIGIPTGLIPGGSVPVNPGSNRYTALERFGYNLDWTTYNGEWDKIDVMSADRMTSEMSIADDIGAAYQSITSGISKAAGNASADVQDAWSSGNVLAVAGSIISWPFKTVFHSGTDSVYNFAELMTNGYERNIFDSNAWNRDSFYDDTAYNIRVLSDTEKTSVYLALVQSLIESSYQSIANKYHIDVSNVNSESAFPGGAPAKVVKVDPDHPDQKPDGPTTEEEAWDDWVSANRKQLEWGSSNISVDYTKYAPGSKGTAADAYASLKSDWNTKATAWRTAEIKKRLKDNMDAFQQAWTGLDGGSIASSAKASAKASLGNNSLFWVCVNDDGTAQGTNSNPIIKSAESAGLRDPGASAFDSKGQFQCRNADGKIGALRAPISGGLFGQQGTSAQKTAHKDTRRSVGSSIMSFFGNPITSLAGMLLSISQKLAMAMNFLVNLSFQPILSSLGIKPLVVNVITTLKDTFYMQLLVVAGCIAVLVAFVKFARGHSVEGLKSIILIFMTVLLGVALLYSPNAAFKLVDDYPSQVERFVAAIILKADSSPNADMCTGTGTPTGSIDASQYKDTHGNVISGFDPDTTVRMAECNIWDAYVFEPWALGQFGTGYDQLYAKGYAPSGSSSIDMNDATAKEVGDAGVNMGGGVTIHNWALYQLSRQVSGTSTTDDASRATGVTDKNLYRLVDLQAGPDNAAGKDTSHWGWWSGSNMRIGVAGLALLSSVAGLMSIGMFAIAKIEATIVSAVLLAIAPIILLIGIVPGRGRNTMRSWGFKIISLVFKRLILVMLLSIQILVLVVVANSNTADVMTSMLFLAAMSWAFAMYGRSLIDAFTKPVEAMGGGGGFQDIDDRARAQLRGSRFVTDMQSARHSFTSLAGAVVGSAAVGGFIGRNGSDAVFSRYESSQRAALANTHRSKMNSIAHERENLMEAYRNGTLTGDEYDTRQELLNEKSVKADAAYQQSIANIDSYKNDFDLRRRILNDPQYRESNEAADQIRRTMDRMGSLATRRNRRHGNLNPIRDSMAAVGELKDEQIRDAYSAIFTQNPELGAAFVGAATTKDAKGISDLVKGADLTDISNSLHITAEMNKEQVAEELDNLGVTYRRTASGEYIPVLPTELRDRFRDKVVENARLEDIRNGGARGVAPTHHAEELTREFRRQDEIERRRAESIDIAEKYLPKDAAQNAATKAGIAGSVIDYGSLYDHAKTGDASGPEEISAQKLSDAVVDKELNEKLTAIRNDDSMSAQDRAHAMADARHEAGARRAEQVATMDYAIGQASEAARREMMKISDDLSKDGKLSIDKDGNLKFDPKDGIPAAQAASDERKKERMKSIKEDFVTMKSYTAAREGSYKTPTEGGTAIIELANREVEERMHDLDSGNHPFSHHRYGLKANHPLRDKTAPQSITEAELGGDSVRGSKLTTGRTNSQAREDRIESMREATRNKTRSMPYSSEYRRVMENEEVIREYNKDIKREDPFPMEPKKSDRTEPPHHPESGGDEDGRR